MRDEEDSDVMSRPALLFLLVGVIVLAFFVCFTVPFAAAWRWLRSWWNEPDYTLYDNPTTRGECIKSFLIDVGIIIMCIVVAWILSHALVAAL